MVTKEEIALMKAKDNTTKIKLEKPRRKRRGKSKKFEQLELSKPIQLNLFELEPDEDSYSQSIELYDFIPKYVWGKVQRLNGKFLDTLKREFECRGRKYLLTLMPARLEVQDGFKEFYPSKREELVEDALRKLMTERQSFMLDGEAGIAFTLYQLQTELKEEGHSYSYNELKDSIRILNSTDIILKDESGEIETAFSPIESYGFAGEGAETKTFVRFSPLITRSIESGTYRLMNYEKIMSYRSVITRQLHKRMSHHFIQASLIESYEIFLTTIVRDFGLTPQKRLQQNLSEVENAVEELKQKNVILNCKIEKIFDSFPRTKLVDVKLKFQPHPEFVNDVKRANAKAKKIREIIL
jgi:hypothetical protein